MVGQPAEQAVLGAHPQPDRAVDGVGAAGRPQLEDAAQHGLPVLALAQQRLEQQAAHAAQIALGEVLDQLGGVAAVEHCAQGV